MDEKKLAESSKIIRQAISEGIIIKPKPNVKSFFIKKAFDSIAVAKRLLSLAKEESLPAEMWVINASYYSMFFAATALLAEYGHKIDSETGIHKLTYHALVHYFVNEDKKIEKHFIEEYKDAVKEAEELLQLCESKAKTLVSDFGYEMSKRKEFTYDLGKIAEMRKAETSFERARNFVQIAEKMVK
jgi:uncharacterized protein (UPF0332 family)